MNCTQNSKLDQVSIEKIIIGVDIASETHYARAFDWRGVELGNVFHFENSQEGFQNFSNWMERIKNQTGKTAVMVGAEPTGHYWFGLAAYLKSQEIQLVLVNPFHVKRSKELDDNHPSKNDRKDPKTIAKLVIEGRFSEPYIPEGVYAELRIFMDCRWKISKELNQVKNRIQRWLNIYFPEHKKVFANFDALSSLMVLSAAPLPTDVVILGAGGVNNLWRKANLKAAGIKRATQLYEAAKNSIGCTNGSNAARLQIKLLMEDYQLIMAQYHEVMSAVENLCSQIANMEKLLEISGLGLVSVAGFISEVGDIRRFQSPKQIQKLAGLALRESSSGKSKGRTTISKRGRARLRAVLFQTVMPLIVHNKEFSDLHRHYTNRPQNPLKKKQSLIALCCKLIRVYYAILSKGTTYDPVKFVSDIQRPETLAA
jgi:transposase